MGSPAQAQTAAVPAAVMDAYSHQIAVDLEWSPDGQLIAYSRDGIAYVMDRDGTHNREIGPRRIYLIWTPDSRALVDNLQVVNGTDQWGWWVYPIDGGEPERLFPDFYTIYDLLYSPDGDQVVLFGLKNETDNVALWVANVTDYHTVSEPVMPLADMIDSYLVIPTGVQWSESGDELSVMIQSSANQ
ncbi:MAG TPA: hypothetical protein VHL11_24950, partial [Phototrophicaceae bacterium]|nr:hypothetical protein [Phototrophicaceae bacterium]